LAAGLRPDTIILKGSHRFFAMAGRRCGNIGMKKEKGEGLRKVRKKREREAAYPRSFL